MTEIALKVRVVNQIKAEQGREQADISQRQLITAKIAVKPQFLFPRLRAVNSALKARS